MWFLVDIFLFSRNRQSQTGVISLSSAILMASLKLMTLTIRLLCKENSSIFSRGTSQRVSAVCQKWGFDFHRATISHRRHTCATRQMYGFIYLGREKSGSWLAPEFNPVLKMYEISSEKTNLHLRDHNCILAGTTYRQELIRMANLRRTGHHCQQYLCRFLHARRYVIRQ